MSTPTRWTMPREQLVRHCADKDAEVRHLRGHLADKDAEVRHLRGHLADREASARVSDPEVREAEEAEVDRRTAQEIFDSLPPDPEAARHRLDLLASVNSWINARRAS